MSQRINNIMTSIGCLFWTKAIFKIILSIVSMNTASIFSSLINVAIQFILATVCILALYNHKDNWNHIFTKIICALIALMLVISVFAMFGAIFSFSLVGLINFVKNVITILLTTSLCIALIE
jgi:hypothetical protein